MAYIEVWKTDSVQGHWCFLNVDKIIDAYHDAAHDKARWVMNTAGQWPYGCQYMAIEGTAAYDVITRLVKG